MVSSSTLSAVLIVVTAVVANSATALAGGCKFTPNCDYGKGDRAMAPAATQDDCCTLCTNRPGCAAGVFADGSCWFKTAKEVANGCTIDKKVEAACIPPSVKPGPPPAPPPPPPPPAPCSTFSSKDTCPPKRCVWTGSACTVPPPPPPPPPAPPLPPAPAPFTPPKCASGDAPVQVFIMMGQSNMLGEGKKTGPSPSLQDAVQTEGKYQYLWNKASGNWSVSKRVRNVFVMGSGGISPPAAITLFHNEFMTAATTTPATVPGMGSRAKDTIGPELGIGFTLGNSTTAPVMTLKTCIGDRALGWDLLPPGSPGFNYSNYTYAGYHESPEKWPQGTPKPAPMGWAAGIQYDGDISRANIVLNNISTFYPGSSCYEVAGFFWWQGDRDSRDMGLSTQYETNLVALIKQLRVQYGSPNAKFVTASLGQTKMGDTDGGGLILDAMLNVANATKYPAFKGNVAAVYTNPLMHSPGSSGAHYGGDAQTYMNIGEAMGQAMVGLLKPSAQ